MKKIFLLLLVSLSLSSCITTQTENKGSYVSKDYTKSMFVISDKVKPGMSKADFISLFGKPYKTGFYFDKDKVLHEDLYYKEQLYIQTWYMINTVFHFENSILISQEQGDENRTFSECNYSSKK
ncbi:hypothetical protein SAMN05444405_1294 [Bacteroides luti]|jgi:hypothetical protein|uniref:Lipoprotein n=1 Tax=Bacteroides luti TaxID=1297750 RepID=A0A1M5HLP2_9BACE|nr:hypothetical protein [Bacteroides luti]SHG16875.1 hypothetical protein SAMN05444405_1294 [Bacteroides luti]